MDLSKFKRFVEQQALYFCGARYFEDPFEGEYAWGKIGHERFLDTQGKLCQSHGGGMPLDGFMAMNLKTLRDIANNTYISCWHNSAHESEAMWKLYCNDPATGIAIRTTQKQLKSQLEQKNLPNLELNSVRYTANFWIKQYNPEPSVFFSKRISFEYEKEFRAVFREIPHGLIHSMPGKTVPIDISTLVHAVRISPLALPELKTEVEGLLHAAGLQIPVETSEIEIHPLISVDEQIFAQGAGWQHSTVRLKTNAS
ncbi:DUF2971 domain-containing protein [Pseudomonas sp. WS 5059]|uniref:DUF2971 domain-containing protein n=1 Tax=Pseudomonas sp. WS 5059 TaxID=2717491 RepID=UPI0014740E54|nr:DUF2971 domain-containing protein [Pseudomonas sp. WS 5059]NMY06001.1 DUF2971 domain-containing protein [Pseudomonas sp. WS 5059]